MQKFFERENIWVWILLAWAFALRFQGVGFGLPDLYHADEPNVVNRALAYAGGDFNPHYFKIPPLVSYLLFVIYGVYFVLALAFGWVRGAADFEALFLSDPSSFYFLGRLMLGVLPGTLCVFLLFKLCRRYLSMTHGFLAAGLLAANFLHVRDSHYIYLDMPLLALLVAAFFPILEIQKNGAALRRYLSFGILYGAAVAVKYNGFFLILPFLAAHFQGRGWKFSAVFDSGLWISGVLSLLTFAALNPYAWLDAPSFMRDLFSMKDFEGFMGFGYHFSYSLAGALGALLLALCLLGLLRNLVRPARRVLIPVAVYVAAYYLVLCFASQEHDRYVLPMIPFLLIFAADLFARLGRAGFVRSTGVRSLVILTLAGASLLPSLAKIYHGNRLFLRTDVRTLARHWLEMNLPDNSKIALDVPFFMPRLKPSLAQLEEKLTEVSSGAQKRRLERLLELARAVPAKRFQLFFMSPAGAAKGAFFSEPRVPYDVQELTRQGIEYVIIARIKPETYGSFYEALSKAGSLKARFTPYKDPARLWAIDGRPLTGAPFLWAELSAREASGQIIEIYRLIG